MSADWPFRAGRTGSTRLRLLAIPCRRSFSFTARLVAPPPKRWDLLFHRPDLIQRVAVEQLAVLHDVMNRVGVLDVLQRIFGHDHHVGQTPGLKYAQVLPQAADF